MSRPLIPPVSALLADSSPGERRLAILRGGRPWRLVIERDHVPTLLGEVRLARVLRVEPALRAAFVDIGLPDAALLPLPRAEGGPRRRDAVPREGESFAVQITAEPARGKGAVVSRRIALPGRAIVLTLDRPGIAASRRLEAAEAARLQGIVRGLAMPDEGIVVRAAAAGMDENAISAELDALRATRRTVLGKAAGQQAGVLWRDLGPIGRCLREDAPAGVPLLVEGGAYTAALRAAGFAPTPWTDSTPLFVAKDIDDDIDAARQVEVEIPGGGLLSIEPTRALVAIDVDGGPRRALDIDIAAATEAARQIRLREIGGQIVIDFVTLPDPNQRRQVDAVLAAAFTDDMADLRLEPMNRLGLTALSRQRLGPALHEIAPPGSAETAVLSGLRALARAARRGEAGTARLTLSAAGAACLGGPLAAARAEAEAALGGGIAIETDPALASGRWRTDMSRR